MPLGYPVRGTRVKTRVRKSRVRNRTLLLQSRYNFRGCMQRKLMKTLGKKVGYGIFSRWERNTLEQGWVFHFEEHKKQHPVFLFFVFRDLSCIQPSKMHLDPQKAYPVFCARIYHPRSQYDNKWYANFFKNRYLDWP